MTVIGLNWLMILISLVLPMIVALVTNNVASAAIKAIVLALLSALAGFLQQLFDAGGDLVGFDWDNALSTMVWTFLLAVGLHFGLLKPVGITGRDNAIGRALPAGIGGSGPQREYES